MTYWIVDVFDPETDRKLFAIEGQWLQAKLPEMIYLNAKKEGLGKELDKILHKIIKGELTPTHVKNICSVSVMTKSIVRLRKVLRISKDRGDENVKTNEKEPKEDPLQISPLEEDVELSGSGDEEDSIQPEEDVPFKSNKSSPTIEELRALMRTTKHIIKVQSEKMREIRKCLHIFFLVREDILKHGWEDLFDVDSKTYLYYFTYQLQDIHFGFVKKWQRREMFYKDDKEDIDLEIERERTFYRDSLRKNRETLRMLEPKLVGYLKDDKRLIFELVTKGENSYEHQGKPSYLDEYIEEQERLYFVEGEKMIKMWIL